MAKYEKKQTTLNLDSATLAYIDKIADEYACSRPVAVGIICRNWQNYEKALQMTDLLNSPEIQQALRESNDGK